MKALKSLGQHFLINHSVIKKIVSIAQLNVGDLVLEIGPGKGALTKELLKTGATVTAIETDKRMVEHLNELFNEEIINKKLIILNDDIKLIKINLINYKIVSNIPYFLTGLIIKKFLTIKNKPLTMILVVQKEIADRAVRSDKKGSVLSESIALFASAKKHFLINKQSFNPPPKVQSAVLEITPNLENTISEEFEKHFFEIIKNGFLHKRKFLINNLEILFEKEKLKLAWNEIGLELKVRPESLTHDQWIKLTNLLST